MSMTTPMKIRYFKVTQELLEMEANWLSFRAIEYFFSIKFWVIEYQACVASFPSWFHVNDCAVHWSIVCVCM